MKRVLLVPPSSWGEKEVAGIRSALIGVAVDLSDGKLPEMVPYQDHVLFVVGRDHDADVLTVVGDKARNLGVDRQYAYHSHDAVVAKIKSIVEPAEDAHA